MLLKSTSENKKLYLDRPILSVRRRCSSLKLDPANLGNSLPVKTAGAIPFQWEKAPGRPKQDVDNSSRRSSEIRTEDAKGRDLVYCDDKAFADALKTLSRIESFLLNSCRGKKGPKTRELMVGGFLPKPTAEKQSMAAPQQLHQQLRLKMRLVCRDNPWSCVNYWPMEKISSGESRPNHNVQTSEKETNLEKDERMGEETRRAGSKRITFEQLLADTWDKSNNTQSLNVNPDMEKQSSRRSMTMEASPPLLKSPADSWLSRTLPSLSAKNVSRHSQVGRSNRWLNQMAAIDSTESETTI